MEIVNATLENLNNSAGQELPLYDNVAATKSASVVQNLTSVGVRQNLTNPVLDALAHQLPVPAILVDEQIYVGDIVWFYDQLHDRDGVGVLDKLIVRNGREMAVIMETKIWTRGRYMQEGIRYEYGDMYEIETEVPVEQVVLADEMLEPDDAFYCLNYNMVVVS